MGLGMNNEECWDRYREELFNMDRGDLVEVAIGFAQKIESFLNRVELVDDCLIDHSDVVTWTFDEVHDGHERLRQVYGVDT